MKLLVAVLFAFFLTSACATNATECDGGDADCPMTVAVEGERFAVGCLPGGVREDLLGDVVTQVTYEPAQRFESVHIEARTIEGVEESGALAIRITGEGNMCGYEDENTWLWAMAPDFSAERAEQLADRIANGE